MKKIGILFASTLAIISLASCGKNEANKNSTANKSTSSKVDKKPEEETMTDEVFFEKLSSELETVNTDNYNGDDYKFSDYKTLLRYPSDHFSDKISLINLKLIQVTQKGAYDKLLAYTPNGDVYMLFIEKSRLETKLLEDDYIAVNGRFLLAHTYTTADNVSKEVPLIYIDAYRLDSK